MQTVQVKFLDKGLAARFEDGVGVLEISRATALQEAGKVRILPQVELKKPAVPTSAEVNTITHDHPNIEIETIVPFEPGRQVGYAYNRAMARVKDWALILDHDVYLVNPLWYQMCLSVIETAGHDAGWITCYTNRIGCAHQVAPGVDTENHDMKYHRFMAKQLYDANGMSIIDLSKTKRLLSGVFILTHRKAWDDAGGFKEDSFFAVDNEYHSKLVSCGYKILLMSGLYVYHGYMRETLRPYFTLNGGGTR